ncbi:MAG: helix-turn-helix transcriptional regulator [Ruminococcus sp.]|nr:helix-turn-helix transcriptional regulator [Ruminococcus sp.]
MSFSERLKEARKNKGLTQAELAKKCGLATGTIQQYELGKRKPTNKNIKKIADALSVGYRFAKDGEVYFYEFRDTIDLPVTNNSNSNKLNLQLFSTDDVTVNSNKVMEQFNKLNEKGQQKALEQIELLTKIQEYLK